MSEILLSDNFILGDQKKTCIVIVGSTAVGKTSIAIKVAQHFNTSIISCDSRQCFTELNIGVAKPTTNELSLIEHHFINSHSINNDVNAATFEQYALSKATEIFATHDIAVMTGGTGLYAKAFCEGMDKLPDIDTKIRQTIIETYHQKGIEWLKEQVKVNDPLYFSTGEIQNPQRLMRALEVKLSTGSSIIHYQTKTKKQRPFNIIKIGIELPRPLLIERINKRVDDMIIKGLLGEVNALLPFQQLNALQTVGYKEIFDYLNGQISLAAAIELIKINTRQYAKRQMTWFKKDTEIIWCHPTIKAVMEHLNG